MPMAVPVLWFGPELWGSGEPLRAELVDALYAAVQNWLVLGLARGRDVQRVFDQQGRIEGLDHAGDAEEALDLAVRIRRSVQVEVALPGVQGVGTVGGRPVWFPTTAGMKPGCTLSGSPMWRARCACHTTRRSNRRCGHHINRA